MSLRAFRMTPLSFLLVAACASSARPMPRVAETQSGLQAGIAAFNAGNYAQAETALRAESGPEASAYLAASLAKQGKFGEAEAPANTALAAAPSHPVAAAALGQSLVSLNRYDDAIARMGGVIGADHNVAYAYYWRAQAYYKKKQSPKMVADLEMFLRLAPDAPEAPAARQLLSALR